MAGTEFHFPSAASPTTSWVPTKDPTVSGTSIEDNAGVAAQLAADNVTQHAEQLSNSYSRYTLAFSGLSLATDRPLLTALVNAALGGTFEFKTCGALVPNYKQVRFAREGFKRTIQAGAGGTFSVTVVLVDAP